MDENINKKHEYKSGSVKVNDFIWVVLKGGDSTFPARVITVPTGEKWSGSCQVRVWMCS